MADRPAARRMFGSHDRQVTRVTDDGASAWFVREIVPLEPKLMLYLRHNWRNPSDVQDLRQEVYARVLQAARQRLPDNPENFLFVCARNLLIDRVRRERIVQMDTLADPDSLGLRSETPDADRLVMEHEDLRRLEAAMAELPKRTRQAIELAYFEGLNRTQIARRMGVSQRTAAEFIAKGTMILADLLSDAVGDRRSKS